MRISYGFFAALFLGTAFAAFAGVGRHEGAPLPPGAAVDRLVVHKGARTLEAYRGDVLLKTYEVALGMGGAGPKRYEGDRRTPEGTYRIDRRHRSQSFAYFLHVSYPNPQDRRRYRELKARQEVPEGAGIGHAIGVHGYPPGTYPLLHAFDWTAGCIAVETAAAHELYQAVVEDAEIRIEP